MSNIPIVIDLPLRRWWQSGFHGLLAGWKLVDGWGGEGLVPDLPSCSGLDKPDAFYRGRRRWRPWRAIIQVVNPCLAGLASHDLRHRWGVVGSSLLCSLCGRSKAIEVDRLPPVHPNCRCLAWRWFPLPPRQLWPEIRPLPLDGVNEG